MSDLKLCPFKKAVNKSTKKQYKDGISFEVFLSCKKELCELWSTKHEACSFRVNADKAPVSLLFCPGCESIGDVKEVV